MAKRKGGSRKNTAQAAKMRACAKSCKGRGGKGAYIACMRPCLRGKKA